MDITNFVFEVCFGLECWVHITLGSMKSEMWNLLPDLSRWEMPNLIILQLHELHCNICKLKLKRVFEISFVPILIQFLFQDGYMYDLQWKYVYIWNTVCTATTKFWNISFMIPSISYRNRNIRKQQFISNIVGPWLIRFWLFAISAIQVSDYSMYYW